MRVTKYYEFFSSTALCTARIITTELKKNSYR